MTAYADTFAGIQAAESASMAHAAFALSAILSGERAELAGYARGDWRRKRQAEMVSDIEAGIIRHAAELEKNYPIR